MQTLHIPNTRDLRLAGKPFLEIEDLPTPTHIGSVPPACAARDFTLKVAVGDNVKIGFPLWAHSTYPDILFNSPAAGIITDIRYGQKNKLDAIVIQRDENEAHQKFLSLSAYDIPSTPRETLLTHILNGGLFGIFREFPYRTIPNPATIPAAIYICLDNDEPHQPTSEVFLKDNVETFSIGVEALKVLSGGNVYIGVAKKNLSIKMTYRSLITHQLEGDYPANDPGVFYHHHNKTITPAWYCRPQDVLRLADLLTQGRYPIDTIIAVGGLSDEKPKHYRTRLGISVKDLITPKTKTTYIAGGVMTGHAVTPRDYLDWDSSALNSLPNQTKRDWLADLKIGLHAHSITKSYLSAFFPKLNLVRTTASHAPTRACITCGDCEQVCPVNLQPQDLFHAPQNDALKTCVECGLCSYICPAKIDLTDTFKSARTLLARSQS